MKLSESWLREWVDPPLDSEALWEQLTMAGVEVKGVEPVAPEFSGVCVAEVLSVDRHPEADKLSVCEVSDGHATVRVVCGAPNVRAGLKTAFARVGALLPDDFRIDTASLRGVESHGMLCSAAELRLGDDADGILELADSARVGDDLRLALALDDTSMDIDLTPNRGDCLSVLGIAREVAVLNSLDFQPPVPEPQKATHTDEFPVRLTDPAGCPRYLGRVIRGVDTTRPTPLWMKEKLRRAGLRAIDPVVDVTNFVMLELGQPMHAFDLAQLSDGIDVRRAEAGETLTLLDGRQVQLDTDTLLITDARGPVAIAGVMGGERSGVRPDTRDVFLECAFFAPRAVEGTARRYGLQTDASHRFERGVDYHLQPAAMERATALLLEIVGGAPGPVTEAVAPEQLPGEAEVNLRHARLTRLVGVEIDAAEVEGTLERLSLSPQLTDDGWCVRVPSHRFDLAIEEDLVEEVCRIYGYNRIPSKMPQTPLDLRRVSIEAIPRVRVRHLLADLGYQETITYSFVDPVMQDLLDPGNAPVGLSNPMSGEQSVMRTTLLPGLIDAARTNLARQQNRGRLFEVGLCFQPGETLIQTNRVGGVLWGSRMPERWNSPDEAVDFFDVKGDVERLAGLGGERLIEFGPREDAVLHPGQSADLRIDGNPAGWLGRLHPELEQRLDVRGPLFVFELDAQAIEMSAAPHYREVSRFPSVRRDLSLTVRQSVAASALEGCIREALGGYLIEFRVFDVYHGEGIDSTEKSVAVGLTLQDPSRTLTDKDISGLMDKAISALETDLGARLR
jgi:phenylalanyl-tRNA synthetase beta chain